MSIDSCLKSHSERQLKIWMHWFNQQWEKPSKDNWYQMQIACEVRRVLSKSANSIKTSDFILKFKEGNTQVKKSKDPKFSRANLSKSIWLGLMTKDITVDGKLMKSNEVIPYTTRQINDPCKDVSTKENGDK